MGLFSRDSSQPDARNIPVHGSAGKAAASNPTFGLPRRSSGPTLTALPSQTTPSTRYHEASPH